jgi:hypothetical protein
MTGYPEVIHLIEESNNAGWKSASRKSHQIGNGETPCGEYSSAFPQLESDLRAEAPNSNYPMFVVASEGRRKKVFDELRRPTFAGPCLRLNEVIRFLGYEKLREIDESSKHAKDFDTNAMLSAGESVPPI